MSDKKKTSDPPRVTVAQAITIAVLLIAGFFALENGLSLVFLVLAMGTAAFVLNRLFALVLWWATRNDEPEG
jgi:hypothetical protein